MTIYDRKKKQRRVLLFFIHDQVFSKNQTGNYKNAYPGCDGYGAFSENKREIT